MDNTSEKLQAIIETKLREIIDKHARSKLHFDTLYFDEYDTLVVKCFGGLNGHGHWDDYLEDLSEIFCELEDIAAAWLIGIQVDVLDDVFSVYIGLDLAA